MLSYWLRSPGQLHRSPQEVDLASIRSRGRMGEADRVSILRGPSRTLVFKHGCRMQERMPSPFDNGACMVDLD